MAFSLAVSARGQSEVAGERQAKREAPSGLERIVSLSLEDVPLEEALRSVVSLSDVELIYRRDVVSRSQLITMELQGVTVRAALEALVRRAQLAMHVTPSGNVILTRRRAPSPQQPAATLRGFITDDSDGRALEYANVALLTDGSLYKGATSDGDGLFVIPAIESGRYTLRVSFVGYETYRSTIDLAPGETRTVSIALRPGQAALEEVVVRGERGSGAARITAGRQTIRPQDLDRVPSPDISGDLANYLTTLPGVVTLGDRGGQLFIRGGEPAQNLVLLDGMRLYQPFHVLGFYSAFPSEIVRRVDLYGGGFPASYGERVASVLDVHTRSGNLRRLAGEASLSPFTAGARIEGPLVPGRLSLLVSGRESMVERWAGPLLNESMPYRFGDVFGKLYAELTRTSRLTISAIATHDRGTLREAESGSTREVVRWTNRAAGLRYLLLPGSLPLAADLQVNVSGFHTAWGTEAQPERTSGVRDVAAAFEVTIYGEGVVADVGMSFRSGRLKSELGGLFQNVSTTDTDHAPFAIWVEPEFAWHALRVRPGLRMQLFEVRPAPFVEPRLRLVWERGIHQVSGAAGIYHQELVGLVDRRDAANVFTVWAASPRRTRRTVTARTYREVDGVWRLLPTIPATLGDDGQELTALHALLGYQVRPWRWLDVSVEGYYRHLDELMIAEWTPYPHLTTSLQPASGRTYGLDARLEARTGSFYAYAGYGLSSTRYEAQQPSLEVWYGTDKLSFRPPHDRRHQLSLLASARLADFDLSLRWAFGSGLPFSRAVAFDGYALIDDLEDVADVPGLRRVLYGLPYNALLPTYHRLDVSLARTFRLGRTAATVQASAINLYDRRNIFYLDVYALRRVDQLPLVPSLGLKVTFDE